MVEDGPSLDMADKNGSGRIALLVLKSGPRLTLLDDDGKSRASLLVDKEGPTLNMADKHGHVGVEVTLGKDAQPYLLNDYRHGTGTVDDVQWLPKSEPQPKSLAIPAE